MPMASHARNTLPACKTRSSGHMPACRPGAAVPHQRVHADFLLCPHGMAGVMQRMSAGDRSPLASLP